MGQILCEKDTFLQIRSHIKKTKLSDVKFINAKKFTIIDIIVSLARGEATKPRIKFTKQYPKISKCLTKN